MDGSQQMGPNPKSLGERGRRGKKMKRQTSKYRKPSPPAKQKFLGNHTKVGCPFCNPTLTIRLDKKRVLRREMAFLNRKIKPIVERIKHAEEEGLYDRILL